MFITWEYVRTTNGWTEKESRAAVLQQCNRRRAGSGLDLAPFRQMWRTTSFAWCHVQCLSAPHNLECCWLAKHGFFILLKFVRSVRRAVFVAAFHPHWLWPAVSSLWWPFEVVKCQCIYCNQELGSVEVSCSYPMTSLHHHISAISTTNRARLSR